VFIFGSREKYYFATDFEEMLSERRVILSTEWLMVVTYKFLQTWKIIVILLPFTM